VGSMGRLVLVAATCGGDFRGSAPINGGDDEHRRCELFTHDRASRSTALDAGRDAGRPSRRGSREIGTQLSAVSCQLSASRFELQLAGVDIVTGRGNDAAPIRLRVLVSFDQWLEAHRSAEATGRLVPTDRPPLGDASKRRAPP
jgi:hypothetical protein